MPDAKGKQRARIVAAVILFVAASAWLTYRAQQLVSELRKSFEDQRASAMLHKPAPDFALPVLTPGDSQAAEVRLADYRGKVVLISFWASWCRPCHVEMPLLNQYYLSRRAQGVEVIAVSTDSDREAALRYATDNRFAFPMVWDARDTVANDYKVEALPTLVIVAPDGQITAYEEGVRYNLEAWLDRQVQQVRKRAPAATGGSD